MSGENFHAQGQYVCYFAEFPQSKFTSKTGGEEQNDVNQVHPGGNGDPVNVEGPTTVNAVTLQKPYDLILDQPLNTWSRLWSQGVKQPLTLIVQPVTSEGIPAGEPDTYVGCSRQSFKKPDVSSGSSEAGMLEISVQPTAKK
jgi:hypothetical protein